MSEVKTLKFEVTEEEANVLVAGLSELPAKFSVGVIQKLQQQAAGQLNEEVPAKDKKQKPQLLKE